MNNPSNSNIISTSCASEKNTKLICFHGNIMQTSALYDAFTLEYKVLKYKRAEIIIA
jgi:hypothetical protein